MSAKFEDLSDEEISYFVERLAEWLVPLLRKEFKRREEEWHAKEYKRQRDRARRTKKAGVVYFVECPATRHIKIGYSEDLLARLAALRTSSPSELRLLGVVSAEEHREHDLHARFRGARIRGEWFRPDAELLAFIRQHAGEYVPGRGAARP